jgi:hypothetical protein
MVELAVATGTMPRWWEREDDATIVTALEVLHRIYRKR